MFAVSKRYTVIRVNEKTNPGKSGTVGKMVSGKRNARNERK
jgi:hypothetical protein